MNSQRNVLLLALVLVFRTVERISSTLRLPEPDNQSLFPEELPSTIHSLVPLCVQVMTFVTPGTISRVIAKPPAGITASNSMVVREARTGDNLVVSLAMIELAIILVSTTNVDFQ